MLYGYGLTLGAQLARHGHLKRSLRYLIVPENYWRRIEYEMVYQAGEFTAGDRVLDIGSPKLLAIYLAQHDHAEVYATDIEPYFLDDYTLLKRLQGLPEERLHLAVEDGRKLSFSDHFFTKVYSISVIEHIPDDGDTECVREIARVLAPGGRCLLTVPFAPESRMEYRSADSFYWAGSSAASEGEGEGTFFQRRYSEDDLYQRLIEPSGLTLRSVQYVGENILANSPHEFCDYLPLYLGPIHPIASRLVLGKPVPSWKDVKKPLCAFIALEKPA